MGGGRRERKREAAEEYRIREKEAEANGNLVLFISKPLTPYNKSSTTIRMVFLCGAKSEPLVLKRSCGRAAGFLFSEMTVAIILSIYLFCFH